jgi:predicted CopG family antitoxin
MVTVRISEETWKDLNKRKSHGETFEEVIKRLMLEEPQKCLDILKSLESGKNGN